MHKSITYIKKTFSLNCKQATILASKSIDKQLTLHEWLLLRWHLFICRHCTNYFNQIRQIIELAHQHQDSFSCLPDEAKQRITRAVLEVEKSIHKNS